MDLVTASSLLFAAGGDGHGGWWPLWLLFWVAVIAAIGTLAWRLVRRGRREEPLDRARAVLAERFARGELSGDEYRERLAQLG
ncbi:MAG: SHOCT domain-containing protein [Actinomycetota bacterium]|nr:SHOCT domain-containing protein [Actinomycetota bacterium]